MLGTDASAAARAQVGSLRGHTVRLASAPGRPCVCSLWATREPSRRSGTGWSCPAAPSVPWSPWDKPVGRAPGGETDTRWRVLWQPQFPGAFHPVACGDIQVSHRLSLWSLCPCVPTGRALGRSSRSRSRPHPPRPPGHLRRSPKLSCVAAGPWARPLGIVSLLHHASWRHGSLSTANIMTVMVRLLLNKINCYKS